MADSWESQEQFKFTAFLRTKQKGGAGAQRSTGDQRATTYQQELKEISKRNVQIKKSYELEKKGLLLNPFLFDAEADLMRKCKYSQVSNYQHLYDELHLKTMRRLDKPQQVSDFYVLARIFKYVLIKTGKSNIEDAFEKDYFTFLAMFQQRLDSQKQEEIISLCSQILVHQDTILKSDQNPDILQQSGFTYNESTFDDLYLKSFNESFVNVSTDSSEEIEENEFVEQEEEKKGEPSLTKGASTSSTQGKSGVITKDDFIPEDSEMIDTLTKQSSNKTPKDRDLFNLDGGGSEERQPEEESSEEEIDVDSLEPSKVNWFKYVLDKYLKLTDEDGNKSALNNADAYVNLLNILITQKKNEEIQEELLDLVGYHNFELLEKLIERRDIIKEQCKTILEKMQSEKQGSDYKGKNMGIQTQSSVTVQFEKAGGKKGKKGKFNQSQMENLKVSNYDLLYRLGFDRDFIDENKRLGLKEDRLEQSRIRGQYMFELERQRLAYNAQVFEKPEMKKDYLINEEENDEYKYVQVIPPPKEKVGVKDLIPITDLPQWAQKAFGTTKHLNQIQSKVYPQAFLSKRNLLISAPTGAGKTNIALLTILSEVAHHVDPESPKWDMTLKQFKIIYIAPLKALASEVVGKFQAALAYLKIQVRELTGDMNMSKQEIQETHIIVSTPEKWDVVTRKTDGMMEIVNVIIIDEIHLLNDERGLVLECLVARAMMTSAKTQKPIRIVGLSATLPNYEDVAKFIGAEGAGTFYFDSSYRPTPLKCGFYGIKNLGNTDRANKIMNEIIYTDIKRILKMGKQVIIFVHRRAETVSAAEELIEILRKNPKDMYLFDCEKSYTIKSEVQKSRNEQIKQLFEFGFSVHNAGLLRKDRNLVEKMFMEGHIKVLISTATLAWGVNLPAYAVIIKGTKMYDSASGEYKDIGIFDVQQIFGRAGRPQFDNEGEAIILTLIKQMDEYVKMMSNRQAIESNIFKGLDNCINAEISCGTIGTLTDGIHWLKRSYYYQRITKNPTAYGIKPLEIREDPTAHFILLDKVTESVKRLNRMQLIRYNEQNESVYPTDMGRIASNYYINVETMSYFMTNLMPHTGDELFLYHLAHADEFKQLEARKEEYDELKLLMNDIRYVQVDKTCFNESHTKVLVLLEAYLRKFNLKTFSLISDMAYIVQNSARLLRAMFEIAMNKNFAQLAKIALRWCQLLDKRLKPDDHPLKQMTIDSFVGKLTNQNQNITKYGYLKDEIVFRAKTALLDMDKLYSGEIEDIKRWIGPGDYDDLRKFLSYVPRLEIDVNILPLTRAILKVQLTITSNFTWNDRWNGKSEPFWIIVDNESEILHSEFFVLHKSDTVQKKGKKLLKNEQEYSLTFFVPYEVQEGQSRIGAGTYYNLQIMSDRWFDVSFYKSIDLSEIQVPDEDYPHTKLLNLRPIHVSALGNEDFQELYLSKKIKFFNPVQTQVFHTLFHTDSNVLIGAPTGSGKTIMSELAMLRVFKNQPKSKIIYVAPLKALAKERIIDWKRRLENGPLKKVVLELTGDITPDIKALQKADILITTPEKWDGISRNWQHRSYVQQVALVVIDEIHLLGQERGPVIEVIVSRMRYIAEQTGNKVRFVGLSTALANAKDVADWLGIHKLGLYNFKPSVRPVPIKVFFEGFSEKHYCPRMATMNKPAFKAIMTHSKDHPVLVFVSSRRQTRLTALDLIALCAADQQEKEGYDISEFKRPFLKMDPEEMHHISELIKDENLRHTLNFGVGMHHAGLNEEDRKIVEDLFVKKKIQVLVTTSTLAWGVNFPARLVVIKGTEFFDPKVRRYVDFPLTDLLQMIGRAGRPQFDETGYACVFVHEEKKNFYKKFLYEPFPVESSLADQIVDHLNAEIAGGTLLTRQNCIDYLTWTYFFRRVTKNPAYYRLPNTSAEALNDYLKGMINVSLSKLVNSGCIEYNSEDETVVPTTLGRLASFYYLSHETMQYLNTALGPNVPISTLINVLSNAKEFFGLPVRHNEDVLNEALTHLVPIKVPKHDLENPHVKANLLIQAHLQRCPLPITDYFTDTKSVLDQSIRVLQGMIDVSATKGFLQTTINLIHLMQMIIQGRWLDQTVFVNIPHFDEGIIRKLARMGVYYLPQLVQKVQGNLKKFFQQDLKEIIDMDELKDIYKALDKVPKIDLKYSLIPVDDKNQPLEGELLTENGEALVTVNLKRLNKSKSQKVVISHFPKAKDASYFILIGNPAKNDILAIKRVSFNRFATKNLTIALPDNFQKEKLELHLLCDSYIGLDQYHHIDLLNVNAFIEGRNPQATKQQISAATKQQPQQPTQPSKAFTSYRDMKQEVLDDLNDSSDQDQAAMFTRISQGITDLLDGDEDAEEFRRALDEDEDNEFDEEENEVMIEKDLDNWI